MEQVLKVLDAFIEQKLILIESKYERIQEQWLEIRTLEEENEKLKAQLKSKGK